MLNKPISIVLFLFISTTNIAQESTFIHGTITDKESGEALPYAHISIFLDEIPVAGQHTDIDGKYKLELEAGNYDIVVSYVGYATKQIKMLKLQEEEIRKLDIQCIAGVNLDHEGLISQKVAEIQNDSLLTETAKGADQIQKSAKTSFKLLKKRFGKKKRKGGR